MPWLKPTGSAMSGIDKPGLRKRIPNPVEFVIPEVFSIASGKIRYTMVSER